MLYIDPKMFMQMYRNKTDVITSGRYAFQEIRVEEQNVLFKYPIYVSENENIIGCFLQRNFKFTPIKIGNNLKNVVRINKKSISYYSRCKRINKRIRGSFIGGHNINERKTILKLTPGIISLVRSNIKDIREDFVICQTPAGNEFHVCAGDIYVY